MLGDTSIPLAKRIDWVWEQVAKVHPEFKREYFQGSDDDPHMIYGMVVDDCCRFHSWPGAQVMDIGANRGVFTALCALNGAYVVAYEPFKPAFDLLKETIARIGLESSVVAINSAIDVSAGIKPFFGRKDLVGAIGPDSSWDTCNGRLAVPAQIEALKRKGSEESRVVNYVPCITLEMAIEKKEWDCVKVDIEGAEFALFLAASDETLHHIKFLTMELHGGCADKELNDKFITRLERVFSIDGIKEGDPQFKGQDRWREVYATRR